VVEERFFEVNLGDAVLPFTASMVPAVDGRRMLLLAGHSDDELVLFGSSRPDAPVPEPQTMLHGGDLIRALAFELPITFDQAYESDLEPLGPYWRLRHVAPSDLANVFDVVMMVDGPERPEELSKATVSFGPVHRTQLEPVPEYVVSVDATELLNVIRSVMGVGWSRE
jgi:hypothetical protein